MSEDDDKRKAWEDFWFNPHPSYGQLFNVQSPRKEDIDRVIAQMERQMRIRP